MNIFDLITLLGGLAMFLYGMRLMGDGLKSGSSGTLKRAMEKVTGTPLKAFLLGLCMTAVIQSSTATIVIISGLVGAGIISLHQSLGIVIGANVGTTVTGQIIRLLDIDASGTSLLQIFKPSTLAPVALIIGIIIIMGMRSGDTDYIGQIAIGFGILFSGLLSMTDAVSVLSDSGAIDGLLGHLSANPLIGYLIGAGVAFLLQSASATIGILQAFSTSGDLTFSAIYAVLVGIYLGDCVTTAIVCNIGARPEAKRVGIVNILFNLSETVLILTVVTLVHKLGLLDGIWSETIRSGGIANTNTIFNLSCSRLWGVYERLSLMIVADEAVPAGEYDELLGSLNPVFIATPAIAFNRCYQVLLVMFDLAKQNADRVSNYLVQISGSIISRYHVEIMNYYYTAVAEFESLGDCSEDILEVARDMHERGLKFSSLAAKELAVLENLLDDMVNALKMNHMERLRNVGAATVARHRPEIRYQVHDYVSMLHSGRDEAFNSDYHEAHEHYFGLLHDADEEIAHS